MSETLLAITIGNFEGFPDPPINDAEDLTADLEDIYENVPVSFTLTYQYYIPPEIPEGPNVDVDTSVDLISYTNTEQSFSAEKVSSQVIRVSGTPRNIFTDGFYTVLLRDRTIQNVSIDYPDGYLAIVGWSIPTVKIKEIQHSITANVTNLETMAIETNEKTIAQDVYWEAEIAVAAFRDALDKGQF
jgi:hypothetical protein